MIKQLEDHILRWSTPFIYTFKRSFPKCLLRGGTYHGSIAKRPGKEKGQMEKREKPGRTQKVNFHQSTRLSVMYLKVS